jgi:exodeoxyribonuclease V alpha subunit
MVGVSLMRSLLAARARGTGVLFVGDVEQLPPVEYGAPLRDFIAAGLPYGELTEIHRNAGTIVRACKAIREGRPFEVDEVADLQSQSPKNLVLIPASKTTAPLKVLAMLRTIRDESPFDAVWETMTCVAVNKKSTLSRKSLNPQIQAELNPTGEVTVGTPFRVGDKVIQLENQFLQLDGFVSEESKVLCCNGEFAKVVEVHPKKLIVVFSEPTRRIVVPRGTKEKDESNEDDGGEDTGCKMDLGSAITVHKAQGSGCPVVIVCLDEYPGASGPYGVCDRSWLYTAISRAEKLCILVGNMATARTICGRRFVWRRKTFMVELLREMAEKVGVAFRKPETVDIW